MGLKKSFDLVGDDMVEANRSDLQFRRSVILRLYDGIASDMAVAVQVSVDVLTGRPLL